MTSRNIYNDLRTKWRTVPFSTDGRINVSDLLGMDDSLLESTWDRVRTDSVNGRKGLQIRGWYHQIYKDWVKDKKIIDIGCGLGFDSIYFATC